MLWETEIFAKNSKFSRKSNQKSFMDIPLLCFMEQENLDRTTDTEQPW
jgi:hypothetical protein